MVNHLYIADFWVNINSIGVLILICIGLLIMIIIILGWKVLFLQDEKAMWGKMGRKSMMLSIMIPIIVLMNFLKFYLDFPEFFQFL